MSIAHQVMCKKTAYICRIKENPAAKLEEGYYLKMRNALEGVSQMSSRRGVIFVKTLTGKTIEI